MTSLLLQKIYGATFVLKGLQVVSSRFGNAILLMSLKNIRWNTTESITILFVLSSISLGFLNQGNPKILFYSIFPLVNIVALTMGLLLASGKGKLEKVKEDKRLVIILGIFVIISILLIISDWLASNRPFLFYRAVGLLFKPSSASFTLCLSVFLIFANSKIRTIILSAIVISFKSMSSLLFTIICIMGEFKVMKRYNNRLFFVLIAPIIALISIYIVDLLYARHLWISVGTRFGIFAEFSLFGGGLGFGSNIVLNAIETETRISDGTLSLLKFQFGVLGSFWGFLLIFYTIRLAVNTNFVLGTAIGIALFAFNIPEVALLSLLLPYILFESYSNE